MLLLTSLSCTCIRESFVRFPLPPFQSESGYIVECARKWRLLVRWWTWPRRVKNRRRWRMLHVQDRLVLICRNHSCVAHFEHWSSVLSVLEKLFDIIRIRIRIQKNSWIRIRIRIKLMRIHSPGSISTNSFGQLCDLNRRRRFLTGDKPVRCLQYF